MPVGEQTVLDDRYVLDELIGQGGMADVYRGTDRLLLRSIAVKVLREVSDPRQRARFIDEARTLAALNHPNLVTLLDAGFTGDRPYLVMELAEGSTLARSIPEGGLPSDQVSAIGRQLADALAYAHGRGVVHRDVKPSNVLLVDDRALLVDFGIARLMGTADHHTKTGDAIGSPAYLAPEQVAGEDLTPAADIFSLGLVLLEALTGLRAYTGSPMEAALARLNTAPPMPASLEPGWRSLIARMTHREPASRPTAAEVAGELAGPTVVPAPAPPPVAVDDLEATGELAVTMEAPLAPTGAGLAEPPQRRTRWRRSRSKLVAAVLLVLAAVAIGVPVLLSQQPTDAGAKASRASTMTAVAARFRAPLAQLHRAVEAASRPGSALSVRLGRVDDALAARHYPAARRALDALITTTQEQRQAGAVTAAQADRIVSAARHLRDLLPGAVAPTTVVSTPSAPQVKPHHRTRASHEPSPTVSTPAAPTQSAEPSETPTTAPTSTAPPSEEPSPSADTSTAAQDRTQATATATPSP
jgi:tRNA A-37 threonylcarbamoyl transferase component Bud32